MQLIMASASLIGTLKFESDTVPVETECRIRWLEAWAVTCRETKWLCANEGALR